VGSLDDGGVKFMAFPQDHEPRHVHGFIGGIGGPEVIVDLKRDETVDLAARDDAVQGANRSEVRKVSRRERGVFRTSLRFGMRCTLTKTPSRVVTTDEQIDDAIARGRVHAIPRVVEAFYDELNDEVAIRFENGARMAFPRHLLEGLAGASVDQLREIEISGPGTGLYWPQIDVGHYVRGLMDGIFGTRRWMQQLGRKGGATKTAAKSAAARENGKKGGRPKKSAARAAHPL
jgi:hypothetical protein